MGCLGLGLGQGEYFIRNRPETAGADVVQSVLAQSLAAADAVHGTRESEAIAHALDGGAAPRAGCDATVGHLEVAEATAEAEPVAAEPGRAVGLRGARGAGHARRAVVEADGGARDVVGQRQPALAPARTHRLRHRV